MPLNDVEGNPVGGYDPSALAAAGYPANAKFITTPVGRNGEAIAGDSVEAAGNENAHDAIMRFEHTDPNNQEFGTAVGDNGIGSGPLAQVDPKRLAGLSKDQLAYLSDALQAKGGAGNINAAQFDDVLGGVTRSYRPTDQQLQRADAALGYVNGLGLGQLADPNDPHTYYVPIVFDGTANNKDAMAFPTNPGIFAKSLLGADSPNLTPTIYETGLGTGPEGAVMGGAFGDGGKGRESDAMNQLSANMASIYASDPDAKIIIVGAGFSRGSAELRDFANEVYQGVPIQGTMDDASGKPLRVRIVVTPIETTIRGRR